MLQKMSIVRDVGILKQGRVACSNPCIVAYAGTLLLLIESSSNKNWIIKTSIIKSETMV